MFSDTFFCVVTDLSMHHVVKTVVSQKGSRVKIARFAHEDHLDLIYISLILYRNNDGC